MKFLCDVHISYKISKFLEETGYSSIHVNSILDKWFTQDDAIKKYADQQDLILLTKDIDFRESHFLQNSPRKLVRVCLGNISNEKLIEVLKSNIKKLEPVLTSNQF